MRGLRYIRERKIPPRVPAFFYWGGRYIVRHNKQYILFVMLLLKLIIDIQGFVGHNVHCENITRVKQSNLRLLRQC